MEDITKTLTNRLAVLQQEKQRIESLVQFYSGIDNTKQSKPEVIKKETPRTEENSRVYVGNIDSITTEEPDRLKTDKIEYVPDEFHSTSQGNQQNVQPRKKRARRAIQENSNTTIVLKYTKEIIKSNDNKPINLARIVEMIPKERLHEGPTTPRSTTFRLFVKNQGERHGISIRNGLVYNSEEIEESQIPNRTRVMLETKKILENKNMDSINVGELYKLLPKELVSRTAQSRKNFTNTMHRIKDRWGKYGLHYEQGVVYNTNKYISSTKPDSQGMT